jgi:hypothetical protein
MAMVQESFVCLCKKASGGEISSDILQKIGSLVTELNARNFPAASAVQTVRAH